MSRSDLIRAFDDYEPTEEQKDRIFSAIGNRAADEGKIKVIDGRKNRLSVIRRAAVSAAALFTLTIGAYSIHKNAVYEMPDIQHAYTAELFSFPDTYPEKNCSDFLGAYDGALYYSDYGYEYTASCTGDLGINFKKISVSDGDVLTRIRDVRRYGDFIYILGSADNGSDELYVSDSSFNNQGFSVGRKSDYFINGFTVSNDGKTVYYSVTKTDTERDMPEWCIEGISQDDGSSSTVSVQDACYIDRLYMMKSGLLAAAVTVSDTDSERCIRFYNEDLSLYSEAGIPDSFENVTYLAEHDGDLLVCSSYDNHTEIVRISPGQAECSDEVYFASEGRVMTSDFGKYEIVIKDEKDIYGLDMDIRSISSDQEESSDEINELNLEYISSLNTELSDDVYLFVSENELTALYNTVNARAEFYRIPYENTEPELITVFDGYDMISDMSIRRSGAISDINSGGSYVISAIGRTFYGDRYQYRTFDISTGKEKFYDIPLSEFSNLLVTDKYIYLEGDLDRNGEKYVFDRNLNLKGPYQKDGDESNLRFSVADRDLIFTEHIDTASDSTYWTKTDLSTMRTVRMDVLKLPEGSGKGGYDFTFKGDDGFYGGIVNGNTIDYQMIIPFDSIILPDGITTDMLCHFWYGDEDNIFTATKSETYRLIK